MTINWKALAAEAGQADASEARHVIWRVLDALFAAGHITKKQAARGKAWLQSGAFTDAALLTLPEGWRIAELKQYLDRTELRLWCPNNRWLGYKYPGKAATDALAIVAASCRARASMEGEG